MRKKIESLAEDCLEPGIAYELIRVKLRAKCYTGFEGETYEGQYAFATDADHELVINAKQVLETVLDREVRIEP